MVNLLTCGIGIGLGLGRSGISLIQPCKSYSKYAFYCAYTLPTPKDKVSKETLDATGLAATRYGYDGGEFGAGEVVIEDDGLLTCGAYTQELIKNTTFAFWAGTEQVDDVADIPAPDGTLTAMKITQGIANVLYTVPANVTSGSLKIIWARTVSGTGSATLLGHNSVAVALFNLTETWKKCSLPVDLTESGGSIFYAVDFRGAGTLTEVLLWRSNFTDTPYELPFIENDTTGTVSVPENYPTTDQGPRFQIRNSDAGEVMMPELLDAFAGVADGDELYDAESNIQPIDGGGASSYVDGVIFGNSVIGTNTGYPRFRVPLTKTLDTTKTYKVIGQISGDDYIGLIRAASIGSDSNLTLVRSGFLVTFSGMISPGAVDYLEIHTNGTHTFESVLDSCSVKELSPAKATIPYKWRPMFNAGDLDTTQNIVTANDEETTFLYYDDVNEMLKASDGTNTSQVACSPVADTEYEIEVSYNDSGLQVSVDGTAGTLVPFVGRIPVGDYLSHGLEAEAPQYVKQMTAEEGE